MAEEKRSSEEIGSCSSYKIVESYDKLSDMLNKELTDKLALRQIYIDLDDFRPKQQDTVSIVGLVESIQKVFDDIRMAVFDREGWLFQRDSKPSYNYRTSGVSCVAIVPFSKVKDNIRNKSLTDYNTLVDSYIFINGFDITGARKSELPIQGPGIIHTPVPKTGVYIRIFNSKDPTDRLSIGVTTIHYCNSPSYDYRFDGYSGSDCQNFILALLKFYMADDTSDTRRGPLLATSCKGIGKRLSTRVHRSPLILHLCIIAIVEASDPRSGGTSLLGDFIGPLLQLYHKTINYSCSDSANLVKITNLLERKIINYLLKLESQHIYDPQNIVENPWEYYLKSELICLKHSEVRGVFSDYLLTSLSKGKNVEEKTLYWKPLKRDDFSDVDSHLPTLAFLAAVHGGLPDVAESLLVNTKPLELIANAMYAIGVFRYKKNNLSETKTQELRGSADKLEALASTMVHDGYMQNKSWVQQILFDENKRYNCDTIDLAYKADARDFLSSGPCAKSMRKIWWGKGKHTKKVIVSPAVKCIIHFISYLFFAAFYSYILLIEMKNEFALRLEIILIFWVVAIVLDEVLQIRHMKRVRKNGGRCAKIRRKIRLYFSEFWNAFDTSLIVLFVISYIMRGLALWTGSSGCHLASNFFFAFDIILVYIRLLQFLAFYDKIGPMLITTGAMITDLGFFGLIMLAFMIGYAVALSHILQEIPSFKYFFFLPYYQIYGELGLDDIMNTNGWFNASNHGSSLIKVEDIMMAGARNYMAIVFTSIYVLMANIVLLNLLIAKFCSTYGVIASRSDFYHVKHKITILREYEKASPCPPPLNWLPFVYYLVKDACMSRVQNKVKPVNETSNSTEDD